MKRFKEFMTTGSNDQVKPNFNDLADIMYCASSGKFINENGKYKIELYVDLFEDPLFKTIEDTCVVSLFKQLKTLNDNYMDNQLSIPDDVITDLEKQSNVR